MDPPTTGLRGSLEVSMCPCQAFSKRETLTYSLQEVLPVRDPGQGEDGCKGLFLGDRAHAPQAA